MYFKVLNNNMEQYGFQYKEGLNVDTNEFNSKANSFGLHFSDQTSIMSFLEYGDDLIAEVEVPIGEPIVSFKNDNSICYKAKRIILKNIRPLWKLDTFKYLIEECNVNVNYDDYLINVAIMSGCNDIADYLKNIRRNKKMKKIICFECGNKSTDYVFKKSIRKYEGDGFKFDLEVETPYCEICGSQLYDRDIEEHIRDKAHNLIISQMKDSDNSLEIIYKKGC